MDSLSVILLTWNNWELTMKRLSELYALLPPEAELVWVDNGSYEEDALANMGWWQKALPKKFNLKFYKFKENKGFGVGNNKGAELATGDVLLFLSNDVIMHKKFYAPIKDLVSENPKTMFSGNLVDWDGGWNKFNDADGREIVVPYCEGWSIAVSKEAWEDIGGFDPMYFPSDFEDVDLSLTAIEKGYSLGKIPAGYFTHMGGMTANKYLPDRMALTTKNKEKFLKKWRGNIKKL